MNSSSSLRKQMNGPDPFKTLAKKGLISPASADWLTLALDPFHDDTVSIAGMPDSDAGDSVVQFFKQSVTLTKPDSVVGKWDCHVCVLPIQDPPSEVPLANRSPSMALPTGITPGVSYLPDLALAKLELGTVVVNSASSNTETWPGETFADPITQQYANWHPTGDFSSQAYSPDTGVVSPMSKIIGGGFEVHNDTELLHKSGSVTMYCMPQARYDNLITHEDRSAGTTQLAEAVTIRQPPSTLSEAQLFPNSRTLSAKDGVYVPYLLDTEQSHFECHTAKVLRLRKSEARQEFGPSTGQDITTKAGTSANLSINDEAILGENTLKIGNMETCGAYFTGLSEETVLTLSIRHVVESRPTAANPQLLSLASQTALYDPLALELYRTIRAELPIGVPVGFNAKGDWFRMVAKHVGSALSTAVPLLSLFGPEFGVVAGAAGSALTAASTIGRKSVPGKATTSAQQKAPRKIKQ